MKDRIILGTMNFGKKGWGINETESFAILDMFYSHGHTILDTSNFYANGNSELIIGKWNSIRRHSNIRICTKVGGEDPFDPSIKGLSAANMIRSLKNSLNRLKDEQVHLFYLHYPDFQHNIVNTLEGVKAILEEELSLNWGISNYTALEINKLADACYNLNMPLPSYLQVLINPVEFNSMHEIIPLAKSFDIRVLSWSPILGGLLSNEGMAMNLPRRFMNNTFWIKYIDSPILKAIYAKYNKLNPDTSLQTLTIKWLLNKLDVDCVMGFDNTSQLQSVLENINSENILTEKLFCFFDEITELYKAYPYDVLSFMGINEYIRKY